MLSTEIGSTGRSESRAWHWWIPTERCRIYISRWWIPNYRWRIWMLGWGSWDPAGSPNLTPVLKLALLLHTNYQQTQWQTSVTRPAAIVTPDDRSMNRPRSLQLAYSSRQIGRSTSISTKALVFFTRHLTYTHTHWHGLHLWNTQNTQSRSMFLCQQRATWHVNLPDRLQHRIWMHFNTSVERYQANHLSDEIWLIHYMFFFVFKQ